MDIALWLVFPAYNIEEEYGVNLPVDAFLQINTLGELYKRVTRSDQ